MAQIITDVQKFFSLYWKFIMNQDAMPFFCKETFVGSMVGFTVGKLITDPLVDKYPNSSLIPYINSNKLFFYGIMTGTLYSFVRLIVKQFTLEFGNKTQ
ncbi:hypothetical protein qu_294 [Acanthamoeba polyphaga mimivirus]|nr:hypothetical protein [Mimivirus reunion]WMV61629.1 hypothetical protein qu_294 [Mimivirus sp.]WMV62606.1 hypothetical protein qu_294 [Acanthamoeba polyphaga mimivirus]WMV63583.1 hypothetical protein qu_294 [Mimivirus sp.]